MIFALLSMIALMVTPVFANGGGNGDEFESELIAGQYNVVGNVVITVEYETLTIEITSDCDIVETHVWVGDDLEDIPRTKKGNPKIGHFPYTADDEIDLTQLDDTIYVLIHAVVDCPCGEETAWADTFGTPFSDEPAIFGNRWGYFLTLSLIHI